jgi:hypothetical protein
LYVLFDAFEDVRVGFTLPFLHVVPVGDIGRLRVGNVLVDLTDPAGRDEAALLGPGELGCVAVGLLDEVADLYCGSSTADCRSAPYPPAILLIQKIAGSST